jgi:hypothetical protein
LVEAKSSFCNDVSHGVVSRCALFLSNWLQSHSISLFVADLLQRNYKLWFSKCVDRFYVWRKGAISLFLQCRDKSDMVYYNELPSIYRYENMTHRDKFGVYWGKSHKFGGSAAAAGLPDRAAPGPPFPLCLPNHLCQPHIRFPGWV